MSNNKPRIIAFYLPQFHTFPENDEWWGNGFTEWTNVAKAKPLFKNHNQPRIPLNSNYYNLLDRETFSWQTMLANQYGVDGFCFYHYWFNGKLLLQKPVECFLERKELNISFCLSWANEPWTRTWDGQNRDVLMPQVYAGAEDIQNHFNYILPYFKDSRYIKINNSPVFLLYRANSITYLEEMIDKWNELAKENGFNGVYFVETLNSYSLKKISNNSSATVYFEPTFSMTQRNIIDKIYQNIKSNSYISKNKLVSYNYLWKRIFKFQKISDKNWAGIFCDWDNTPRKKRHALIVLNTSVQKFYVCLKRIYELCLQKKCPFIFINAWNEWAEGTYLEPDEKQKYGFLEAIKKIKG